MARQSIDTITLESLAAGGHIRRNRNYPFEPSYHLCDPAGVAFKTLTESLVVRLANQEYIKGRLMDALGDAIRYEITDKGHARVSPRPSTGTAA